MDSYTEYKALDRHVLAVAVINSWELEIKNWAVYIGKVPGKNHLLEKANVAKNGNKLAKSIAVAIFPGQDPELYRE